MNTNEAKAILENAIQFGKGVKEDYCTKFNGEAVENMEQILEILEYEVGELIVNGRLDGDDCYVVVKLDSSNEFKTPVPTGSALKVMEALYVLIP